MLFSAYVHLHIYNSASNRRSKASGRPYCIPAPCTHFACSRIYGNPKKFEIYTIFFDIVVGFKYAMIFFALETVLNNFSKDEEFEFSHFY